MSSRSIRTNLLNNPEVQSNLKLITVAIQRSYIVNTDPKPIQRDLDDPKQLKIHREGEGTKPILDRSDVICNMIECHPPVAGRHRTRTARSRTPEYYSRRSRSQSPKPSTSRYRSPKKCDRKSPSRYEYRKRSRSPKYHRRRSRTPHRSPSHDRYMTENRSPSRHRDHGKPHKRCRSKSPTARPSTSRRSSPSRKYVTPNPLYFGPPEFWMPGPPMMPFNPSIYPTPFPHGFSGPRFVNPFRFSRYDNRRMIRDTSNEKSEKSIPSSSNVS